MSNIVTNDFDESEEIVRVFGYVVKSKNDRGIEKYLAEVEGQYIWLDQLEAGVKIFLSVGAVKYVINSENGFTEEQIFGVTESQPSPVVCAAGDLSVNHRKCRIDISVIELSVTDRLPVVTLNINQDQ